MVIEFIDEPKKPASDLVNEARELLANAAHGPLTLIRYEHGGGRLMREEPRDLIADFYDAANREMYFRAPDLLSQLCDELDQQSSRIATQAESLSTCHARMRLQKEAIERAIKYVEVGPVLDDDGLEVLAQLRSSITPKGEQS